MTRTQHIIAIGGGGFQSPNIARYAANLTPKNQPLVAYLGTACGEKPEKLAQFHALFEPITPHRSHLSFFWPHTDDMAGYLLSQDLIYVGGGNTKTMLAIWREWGIDDILRQAYAQGIVLMGSSAGGLCWFEYGATDSYHGRIAALPCMGMLKGSFCPHYNTEPLRPQTVPNLLSSGAMPAGYVLDDCTAVHFENGQFKQALSEKEGGVVRFMSATDEKPVAVKVLSTS